MTRSGLPRRRRPPRPLALLWAGIVACWAVVGAVPGAGALDRAHVVFHIGDGEITESSSLVVSTAHRGLVYTANDSGDGPFVYVLDRNGGLVGTTTLAGVDPVDIEAMSGGSDGTVVVADVGDNDEDRDSIEVYRIPQPEAGDHTVTPDRLTLTYADGPHNAESTVYDARSGRVFVVTKEVLGQVYATGPQTFDHDTAVLRQVAAAPVIATDAALLPGGRAVVVRTYGAATVYRFPRWEPVATFGLPAQRQGESITGVPGEPVVWAGSEGENSPVWSVPLPSEAMDLVRAHRGSPPSEAAPPRPTAAPSPQLPSGQPAVGGDDSGLGVRHLTLSAGVLVVVVGATVWLSRRRRGR